MISKFFDSQNQPKSDFDAILLENRNFPGHVTNRKVVDNGQYCINTRNKQNRSSGFWEKSEKPSKMADNFFKTKDQKSGRVTLSPCRKSKKSLEPFSRKLRTNYYYQQQGFHRTWLKPVQKLFQTLRFKEKKIVPPFFCYFFM